VVITIFICLLGLSIHLIYVNKTIMSRLEQIEDQISDRNNEVMYLLNIINQNQERSKLAQLIKDKPKQFIRKPQ